MNTEDLKYAVLDPKTGCLVVRAPGVPKRTPSFYRDRDWEVRNARLDPNTGALVVGNSALPPRRRV